MKRALSIILALSILLSLTACGGKDKTNTPKPTPKVKVTEVVKATASPEPTAEPTAEPSPTPKPQVYNKALYDEVIVDLSELVNFRLSDSFDAGKAANYPGISNTLKNALNHAGVLKDAWDNMTCDMIDYTTESGLGSYGYVLHDINEDSLPELFFVSKNRNILAIFIGFGKKVVSIRKIDLKKTV